MEGFFLRFYLPEQRRHHGKLLWEWLLEAARRLDIRGGSAFRAIAGFGQQHHLHEMSFFELAGSLVVEVEFIVTEEEAQRLLDLLQSEKIRAFYARIPAQFGVTMPSPEIRSNTV